MEITEIKIDDITSNGNIRNDELDIEGLSESIKNQGLLQPILVQRKNGGFSMVAGHRRLRACRVLGWTTIPAVVEDYENKMAVQLTENLQRRNMSMLEESTVIFKLLKKTKVPKSRLGKIIGKDSTWVTKRLAYHDLREFLSKEGIFPERILNKMTYDIALIVSKYDQKYWIEMCSYLIGRRWLPEKIKDYCESVVDPDYVPKKKTVDIAQFAKEENGFSIMNDDHQCSLKLLFSSQSHYRKILTLLKQCGGEVI